MDSDCQDVVATEVGTHCILQSFMDCEWKWNVAYVAVASTWHSQLIPVESSFFPINSFVFVKGFIFL